MQASLSVPSFPTFYPATLGLGNFLQGLWAHHEGCFEMLLDLKYLLARPCHSLPLSNSNLQGYRIRGITSHHPVSPSNPLALQYVVICEGTNSALL